MNMLELTAISKQYPGGVQAVDQVSLTLKEGELGVLVGPSGCGKTTTLRMIAGLETPDEGTIRIRGQAVEGQRQQDRDVAMMFQSSALFPWLSVAENLAFGLAKKNLDRHGRQSQIEAIARQLQLEDLLERKARTLSGGQRQRVALGRALLKEAAVLLMDEPLSSLDRQLRLQLQDEILRLCRQRGQTALLVTHDQSEALNLADRLVVMNQGRIEQNDIPQRIVAQPATLFAAQFIGERPINLWTVRSAAPQSIFQPSRIVWPYGADTVVIGVRPQQLRARRMDSASGSEEAAALMGEAVIEQFHWTGAQRFGSGRLGGSLVEFSLPEGMNSQIGDRVVLSAEASALHFFDPETGRRLSCAAIPVSE